ncbi:hypothetical protein FVEG_17067 [Fusarium verticillioides 7600]|uniref:Rhodopsin domain-containing protein n=1 Tax=Gibberella moniliformis (strain M3125 / FGSC 7600) TaxID=334819 RepID=W7MZB8_GIBM7|nr:hypothetical protein FVEG_17067 [Fusarium verticillioides 7600]EWG53170.1 hypothetical protein FVEG_17067 [Fusarium verticillioides 7600]
MPRIEDRPSFIIESWTLYVFGTLILFSRFAVRFKTVGWRGLQGDGFFSFLVLILYAVDAFTIHLIYYFGTNIEAGVAAKSHTLMNDEIHEYETASKLELAAWYAYTALIWCLKGTMLFFFSRMTIGTWHDMFVKTVLILCAASYLAVFLTITFGCFPTQKNWQVVPDPGGKCSFKIQNFLVTTILNVLTGALILGIPMPLLWKLQIPFRKKLVVCLLLSSGAFVIAAAMIRVVLTLSANPSALTINAWGVRETIVGILTVNIPILRPIFSKSFWNGNSPSEITSSYRTTAHGTRGGNTTLTQDISGPYELTPINRYVSTEVRNNTYTAISLSNFDFSGKAVLITGASRGPGLAIAISLIKARASQISIRACSNLSSSSASIFNAASKAGRKRPTVLELNMDVSNVASIDSAASKIRPEFGRLDIVVNSARILAGNGNLIDSDPEGWTQNFYITPRGKKSVVNVSSIGTHCISPTLSGYQISKLAILRLAEFATVEYGDEGLFVYSIHPGSATTEMLLQQWP